MTVSDYYNILSLPENASVDDIKRAYRKKARMYHPDINHLPEAKDLFISATEAYEFLITNHEMLAHDSEAGRRVVEDWRRYGQDRSRQRARAYARASYIRFRKTQFYKATRILDGTTIIISLVVSVAIIFYTIIGYIYRLRHPLPDIKNPTVFVFLLFLALGMLFFIVSLVFLKAYIESSRSRRDNTRSNAASTKGKRDNSRRR